MSNFWKEFAFPSPIDDILKKPDFTLEELLDEDDVVVDVRSQKEALKEFLMNKDTLKALIKYVVEEAPEDASEAVRFRYPVVACEILTAEVDEIEREVVSDLELLSSLFGFFNKEKVNPLMANLVLRTLLSLMTTQLVHMLDFIKSQPQSLENLISHIDCAAVPDLIMRLINSDADYEGQGTLQWLVDNDFAKMLISRFSPECESLQSDLARTVIEILATSSESSILLKKLSSPESVDLLIEQIFKEGNFYGFRSGLAVLSQLLRTLASHSHPDTLSDSTPESAEGFALLIKKVISILPRLNQLLLQPNKVKKMCNQNREEFEAFGFFRLVILQYFESLLMLGNDALLKDLITNHVDVYKNIFEMLFLFPTNNFCHLFAERIISSSLSMASNEDIVEFVKQAGFAQVLLEKCLSLRTSKFMGLPFLYKVIASLQDRQRRTEQLDQYLSTLQGWEELTSMLEEELRSLDAHRGRDLASVSSHEASPSDESVESSNDADDYDTQQAEVLLSKGDLDALF